MIFYDLADQLTAKKKNKRKTKDAIVSYRASFFPFQQKKNVSYFSRRWKIFGENIFGLIQTFHKWTWLRWKNYWGRIGR